jgi:phenylacetate-coenzyme A ligase PaaK-like adenylate-forming protein
MRSMSGNLAADINTMNTVPPEQIAADLGALLQALEHSQWQHRPELDSLAVLGLTSRQDLRAMAMAPGFFRAKTSGSTGEPVTVEKTYGDYIWYMATNIRALRWRRWDVSRNVAIIKPLAQREDRDSWGIPTALEPVQGNMFVIGCEPIDVLQAWLEEKKPHYLMAPPTIASCLNLTRISSLLDWKGSGEVGGSTYSSEECGTIAIECPDNRSVMHVMENQLVETDAEGGLAITTLTNPYIRRYRHGDKVELATCGCGRSLQTIAKVRGRIRNMYVLANGDRKWPLLGSKDYAERFGIDRFKAVQTAIGQIELQLISRPLGQQEQELVALVRQHLDPDVGVTIKYVDAFPDYKFEEFVSLVS